MAVTDAAPPSASLQDAVRAEQVRLLYATALGMYATLLAGVCISALFVFQGVMKPWAAALWLGVMAAHITVRMFVRRAFRRSPTAAIEWRAWANRFTLGAAVAGITWGIGGILIMPPGRFDLQMLLILTVTSIVYATLSAFASWFPAFFAFEVTSIAPIGIRARRLPAWANGSIWLRRAVITANSAPTKNALPINRPSATSRPTPMLMRRSPALVDSRARAGSAAGRPGGRPSGGPAAGRLRPGSRRRPRAPGRAGP